MAELFDQVPGCALAVYAHPDDPEVSCGGTLARWARAGAEVVMCIVTQGDKGSSDPTTDPAGLAARRADEVAASAAALGLAGHRLLGYPDGEVTNDLDLRRRLTALVRALRPQVVVCPDPTAAFFGRSYVNHRDHREVGWATLDVVSPAAASPLYFPDEGPPHQVPTVLLSGTLEPDTWVDIGDVLDDKTAALLCHASQVGEPGPLVRSVVVGRAEETGRAAGIRHAEAYRRLQLA